MRLRWKSWYDEELSRNDSIVKEAKSYKGKWKDFFGNSNPIYLEIGFGKGSFIFNNSIQNPDKNFVGIERQRGIVALAAKKIRTFAEGNTKNIALICADVSELFEYFEVGEVKRIYINFCDPWPKKKWSKRRLTHRGFLDDYKKLLGKNGQIHFKTDNRELFEFSLNELCDDGWKLSNITLDLHKSGFEGNIMTEYEAKFSSKGFPIYRLEATWIG